MNVFFLSELMVDPNKKDPVCVCVCDRQTDQVTSLYDIISYLIRDLSGSSQIPQKLLISDEVKPSQI